MHLTNDLSVETLRQYINRDVPRIVLLWVLQKQHFVLLNGISSDNRTMYVNDPGFPCNTWYPVPDSPGCVYDYHNDVVGYRIFDMK